MFQTVIKPTILNKSWFLLKNCRRHITVTRHSSKSQKSHTILKDPRRLISSVSAQMSTASKSSLSLSKERIDAITATLPEIITDLTEGNKETNIPEVNTRFAEVLNYAVASGKRLRAHTTIAAYELLEKPQNLTPKNIKDAIIMGWIEEILQGTMLMFDDIIDDGKLRRGVPCWHRREDIGLYAVNDGLLVEQAIYALLKKHFRDHHCYLPALELFHESTKVTLIGQTLDCMNTKKGKPMLERFTMERYRSIVEYKTGLYTFHLPIALAMCMANLYDKELHNQVRSLSMELAIFFQMQDDYIDCYGETAKSGKKGNDIEEGKCTWLAAMALERVNPSQKIVMEKYYGSQDVGAVETILNLYEELDLPNIYELSQKDIYNELQKNIKDNISNKQLQEVYFKLLRALKDRKF